MNGLPRQDRLFHAAALFLLWAYPFAKFLLYNGHPLARVPVLGFLGLFAAFSALAARLGELHPLLRSAPYAAGFLALLTATGDRMPSRRLLLSLLAAVAVALAFAVRPRLLKPVATIFLAGCLLSEVALAVQRSSGARPEPAAPGAPAASGAPDPPPSHVVHLILDEHIGLAGLPPDIAESAAMRAGLESFYTSRGFTLYGNAYSHYASSQDSIPSLLNGRLVTRAGDFFEGSSRRTLKENRLFDVYHERGYTLHVYQSRYIDYCAHPAVSRCVEYNDNSVGSLEGQPLRDWEKAWVIGSQYLSTNALWRSWGRRTIGSRLLRMKVGPLATIPATIESLRHDILSARANTAFFAHLHMPHSPYVYDAQCRVRPVADWLQNKDDDDAGSAGSYALRYQRYYGQMECLESMLDALLNDLAKAGLLDRTTMVLHGDHGSRITRDAPERREAGDLLSLYSTFVAIRSPGAVQGRADLVVKSAGEILWEAVAGRKPTFASSGEPTVFMRRRPRERDLVRSRLPSPPAQGF